MCGGGGGRGETSVSFSVGVTLGGLSSLGTCGVGWGLQVEVGVLSGVGAGGRQAISSRIDLVVAGW